MSSCLMTVKAWDENDEVTFYEDIYRVYKEGDHFILEDVFGNKSFVPVKDDGVLEVS